MKLGIWIAFVGAMPAWSDSQEVGHGSGWQETRDSRPAASRPDAEIERIRLLVISAEPKWKAGEHEAARATIREAWRATKALPDAENRKDAMDLRSEIGRAAHDAEDLKVARLAYGTVMAFRQRTLHDEHADLQSVREELAIVLKDLGDTKSARAMQEKVLEIRSRTLSEEHPDAQRARLNLAVTMSKLGDLDGALAIETKALEVFTRTLPDEHLDLQKLRLNLAVTMRSLGDLKGALALEEKALGVLVSTLPGEHPYLDKARSNLAATRARLGDHAGALALYEKILEVRSGTLPEEHAQLQAARLNLGAMKHQLGDLSGALALSQKAFGILLRTVPEDHRHLQVARVNLAAMMRDLGDLAGALALGAKAVEVYSRTVSDQDPDLQKARLSVATTKAIMGDLEGARKLFAKVLEIRTRTLRDEHPDLQTARLGMAATLLQLGELDRALALSEKAFKVLLRSCPDQHPMLQEARSNLASAKADLGDLEGALVLQEKVLDIRSRTLPDWHTDLQTARSEVAQTMKLLGDLRGALVLEETILAVRTRTLPEEHPWLQNARTNLAVTRSALGDVAGAMKLFQGVFEHHSRTLHDAHPDLQKARGNLALAKQRLGDFGGALTLQTKVLEVFSRTLPDQHPHLQLARSHVAATKYRLGDLGGALSLDEQVYQVASQTLPDEHPDLQAAGSNLAAILANLGEWERCRSLLLQATAGARARLDRVGSILTARAHREATGMQASLVSRLLSCAVPGAAAQADQDLGQVLVFRGLVDRQARIGEVLLKAAVRDPELRDRVSAVREADASFRTALAASGGARQTDLRTQFEARERVERELNRMAESRPLIAEARRIPELRELVRQLPVGAAAIVTQAYTRYFPWDKGLGKRPDPIPSVAAFVLARDGSVRRFELGDSERLESLCAAAVRSCSTKVRTRSDSIATPASRPQSTAVAEELGKILEPVFSALPEGTRLVYVAPDSALASIPWEVLAWRGRSLREHVSLRYVETLAAIMPRPAIERPRSVLAFGGIDYGGEPVAVGPAREAPGGFSVRGGGSWAALPGSRREVAGIREIYLARWPDSDACRVVTEVQASKASFRNLAPSYRTLHLATHGFVAEEAAWKVGHERGDLGEDFLTVGGRGPAGYAHGLLSGIVFAGANRKVSGGRDDSVLTAAELATLDLSGCELAVLSACQTNVGPRCFGEAVTGLNRALQLAGARYTITSLWKVDDEGAAALFQEFYRALWQEGLSVPQAFDKARRCAMEAGHGPGVWAGFVLYVTGTED